MAHYAFLNDENVVVQVISGVDENVQKIDVDGNKVGGSSENWEKYYESLNWFSGLKCKRTSYNAKIRGNYAGIGFLYLKDFDIFIAPKCHKEAILNVDEAKWECNNINHETLSL